MYRSSSADSHCKTMTITSEPWGSVENQEVEKFTLKNGHGFEVDVLSYGATIRAIRTPDKHGNVADVVLGFDNIEGKISIVHSINCLKMNPAHNEM